MYKLYSIQFNPAAIVNGLLWHKQVTGTCVLIYCHKINHNDIIKPCKSMIRTEHIIYKTVIPTALNSFICIILTGSITGYRAGLTVSDCNIEVCMFDGA